MSDEHQSRLWPAKLTLLALIDKVAGLSVCLIEHGNVVKDGEIIGANAGRAHRGSLQDV